MMPGKRRERRRKRQGKGEAGDAGSDAAVAPAETPELRQQADALKEKGNTAFKAGNLTEAIGHFTAAIRVCPHKVYFSNRSAAYASAGRAEDAEKDARECVRLDDKWVRGHSRLGTALSLQGRWQEAVQAYAAGIAIAPSDAQLLQAFQRASAMVQGAQAGAPAAAPEAAASGDAAAAAAAAGPTMESSPVVGIDLGTTYSCVAVWSGDGVEVIANAEGNRTTPSIVAFTDDARLIGDPAKAQAATNPANTVYDAKRLIGGRWSDSAIQADARRLPFTVEGDTEDRPMIVVRHAGQERKFLPEQVSSMVLTKMKETAEAYLGKPVSRAVITVPAYFNDSQRKCTKNAGRIAGLNVLRIINEPTAAALAYGLDEAAATRATTGAKRTTRVLIFDLGGGTFDVSILSIEGGIFEVVATGGDTHLGGEDFDDNTVDWLVDEFSRRVLKQAPRKAAVAGAADPETDIRSSKRAMRRLRTAAERAKRMLSTTTSASVEVDDLFGGHDFATTLTRAKFEALNQRLFTRCADTVKRVLRDAKLKGGEIDDVVLVGGSTRIPRVQALLSEQLDAKELCRSINPDEAVANGAAVQGAILGGIRHSATNSLLLVDVTPLSLGIETTGKLMSTIIKRNTAIPVRRSQVYTTEADFQSAVDVCIYEGERSSVDGNNLLGEFTITGIQRARRGEPQIEVSFDLDANGILNVTAKDKDTGATNQVSISNERGRLSDAEVDRMVAEAERFREQDELMRQQIEARNALEGLAHQLSSIGREASRVEMVEAAGEAREWLADNPEASAQEVDKKREELGDRFGFAREERA